MHLIQSIFEFVTKNFSNNHSDIEDIEYSFQKEEYPVVELEMHYPTIDRLDYNELHCYEHIKTSIDNNIKIDVGNSITYLFLYLFQTTLELKPDCNYKNIIKKVFKLSKMYSEHEKVVSYCNGTIADIYYCFGNYDKYLFYLCKNNENTHSSHASNEILSLKYFMNKQIKANDLSGFFYKDLMTDFGKKYAAEINEKVDNCLQENSNFIKVINEIVNKELTKCQKCDKENRIYRNLRFSGNPHGYDISYDLLFGKCPKGKCICFWTYKEFNKAIKELYRDSENIVREKYDIPKVGEGWVSETELYYKIKNAFPTCNVIHQYRCDWLDRQSIDIFIEDYNIAIEYQGIQHYKPVERFGGKEGFENTVARDKKKKRLCKENGVMLIYVNEGYILQNVIDEINRYSIK